MAKKVLIIGGGIAGLAAGSYLRRNGFETMIFERHALPGGLCTAWERGGYRFDGCIHWLMGSSPRSNMHHLWRELGAAELEYREWEIFSVQRLADGDAFTLYTDPDRFEAELLHLGAPEDAPLARSLAAGVRAMSHFDLPAAHDKLRPGEMLRLLAALPGALPVFTHWTKVSVGKLIGRIASPKLKEALSALYGAGMNDFPVAGLFFMLGFMAKRSCGYPVGGSMAFAKAIERRYLELGGEIEYGFDVDRVIVEGDAARGVEGQRGERRGDYIVAAGDAHDLIHRLLGGRYANAGLTEAFKSFERFPSLLILGLGLRGDWSDRPHTYSFPLAEPISLGPSEAPISRLGIRFFNFDRTAAPEGKTAAVVTVSTRDDERWIELRSHDRQAYAAQKADIAEALIGALDKELPGLREAVEIFDLATPATIVRYTGNWRGSFEGWLPTTRSFGAAIPRTLDGLSGLYMVGQWLNPGGGLPPCAMDGRRLARRLCRAEGIRFSPDPA